MSTSKKKKKKEKYFCHLLAKLILKVENSFLSMAPKAETIKKKVW